MTRDQLAALARAVVTIAIGLAPFVALGLVAGLPVSAAAYLALATVAGAVFACSEWRPW